MKKIKEYIFGLILLIVLIPGQYSCVNKSQAAQSRKKISIEGLYIGSYLFDQSIVDATREPQYFSFIIKPGGDLSVESLANGREYYARGRWKLEGSILHCIYRYTNSVTGEELEQITTAVWSEIGTLSGGNWHNKYTPEMKGSFSMNKIN